MAVTLPDPQLPGDPQDALQSIQRNFEALARVIVGTNQIADGAVTGDKVAPSTTANASNESGVTGTLTLRKYADGLIVAEGDLSKSGGFSSGDAVATVPAGFRPGSTLTNLPVSYGSDHSAVSISTAGVITISLLSPSIGLVALNHITFHAG